MAKRKGLSCPKTGSKRKFNKKTYTLKSTSSSKTAAKKTAANLRAKGKSARVVKNSCGHAVYTRG